MRARECARVVYMWCACQFLNMNFIVYQNFLSRTKMKTHGDMLFFVTLIRNIPNSLKIHIIHIVQAKNLICGFIIPKIAPKCQCISLISVRKCVYLLYTKFYSHIHIKSTRILNHKWVWDSMYIYSTNISSKN